MRFLLSLFLPLLPLEALRPCWSESGKFVVMDQGQVRAISAPAQADGVTLGMRQAGVAAMSPDATALDRDITREADALHALALAMMRFTPEVALQPDFGMLLDVGASLRLFGGHRALCRLVRDSANQLGFTVCLGAAPTAGGAWMLARAPCGRRPPRRRCVRSDTLARLLDRLGIRSLAAAWPHLDWLRGIGATDLAALRRLPRAGLLRRTGAQLLQELDRAYGELPEMQRWIAVAPQFSGYAETFDRIEHAEALMCGATALILQMTGWLTVQQLAVAAFALDLEHERGRAAVVPTTLEIRLGEPTWKEPHLLRLLKERLAKVELTSPVIALRLRALDLQAMLPPTDQLFPEPGGSPEDFTRLLEVLSARLGAENVLMPAQASDHRPEACNSWVPATSQAARGAADPEPLARPSLLLPKPVRLLVRDNRPFYTSALRLIKGPERIEAGWWNDQTVARDYYIAQGADATCYWIYLERTHEAQWYLHGLYG
ncbi:Y-family DNA polymerase [Duganella sp. LjRoot269]|uniref:Y-family DNA polymerase n=1 Tax=Duganella sp. LjRoot269 TaxID=3342305 RepID=UPI003ECF9AF0